MNNGISKWPDDEVLRDPDVAIFRQVWAQLQRLGESFAEIEFKVDVERTVKQSVTNGKITLEQQKALGREFVKRGIHPVRRYFDDSLTTMEKCCRSRLGFPYSALRHTAPKPPHPLAGRQH